MAKKISYILLFLLLSGITAFSQTDSSVKASSGIKDAASYRPRYRFRDSASLAQWLARKDSIQSVKDSLQVISDSLSMVWIKRPDPNRPNRFLDSLIKATTVKNMDFVSWGKKFPKKNNRYDLGTPRTKGEMWVLIFVVCLLLFFAILKNAFSKELGMIIQSFYSNRVLTQVRKEDTLFNSWPFILLYVLFGFTIGMFLYLCGRHYQVDYAYSGFEWFIVLSLIILGLFTFKIIILRVLGFLFDIQRLVGEYIAVLYLSYFNAAILFLPLVVAFSLTSARYTQIYMYMALLLLSGIFFFQYIRGGANILSNYRFSKAYLFLYLCALEICPLLILIKALRL